MFSTLSFNFLNWQQFVYEMQQTRRQKLSRLFHQIFSLCSSIVSGHVTWSHVSRGMMHVTIIAPPTITSIERHKKHLVNSFIFLLFRGSFMQSFSPWDSKTNSDWQGKRERTNVFFGSFLYLQVQTLQETLWNHSKRSMQYV